MATDSFVRIAIAGVLFAWLFLFVGFHNTTDVAAPTLRGLMDSYSMEVTTRVRAYRERMDLAAKKRLSSLYEELDVNKDNCIAPEEFKGLTLSVLATAHSIEIPELPDVSELQTFVSELTFLSIVRGIVTLQLLFLVSLYVLEHVRALFVSGHGFHLDGYETKTAPHVDKSIALTYDTPLTAYERIKMAFFFCTGLLFVRLVLMFLLFCVAVCFINLSVWNGRTREKNPYWFGACRSIVLLLGSLMLACLGFYRIQHCGTPASRKEAKVIIGNHFAMIELVNLFLQAGFPSFVSRVENLSVPMFPGLVKASKALLVDRGASDSRTKTAEAIKERARSSSPDAPQMMIFPEGTCNNQRALFEFKRGAFEPGVPIQMVASRIPYKHFNICWSGRCTGGCDLLDLVVRMCCQFVNHFEVVYLPVYTPTEEEKNDAKKYSLHCRSMLANVLGIATSDAKFEDYVELGKMYRKKEKIPVLQEGGSNSTSPQVTPQRSPEAPPKISDEAR